MELWHPVMIPIGIVLISGVVFVAVSPPRRLAEKLALAAIHRRRSFTRSVGFFEDYFFGETDDQVVDTVHGLLYSGMAAALLAGIAMVVCAFIPYATPSGH